MTALPVTLALAAGAVIEPVGLVLSTVTLVTLAELVVFPTLSVDTRAGRIDRPRHRSCSSWSSRGCCRCRVRRCWSRWLRPQVNARTEPRPHRNHRIRGGRGDADRAGHVGAGRLVP